MIGRATTVDISDGSRIKYTYNNLDQTTKKYYKYNGTEKTVDYTYRSDGLPQNSSYSANFNSSYGYDLLNRPSSQTITTTNNSTITFERYYYTPIVNGITYETNLVSQLYYDDLQHIIDYTYDDNGNITRVYDSSTLGGTYYYSYEYDELGQLIRENNQYLDRTYTYTYDNGGNILTKTEYQFTEDSLEGQTHFTTTYTYGDAEWKDLLTAYDGYSITYDAIGNPLTYIDGEQLTWENGRQLANIITEDGFLYTYKYDANGIRTQKSGDGEVIDFYLDGANIIGQKVNDNTMWFYYDNAGKRVALEYNGEVYYYVYNAQGDVVSLASKNGMPVVYYFYDAWGKLLGISGDLADTVGSANPFRYRGYYYDGETCFYYLNSRYYDPETGRFINADGVISGVGSIQGYNMFAYCFNNPINMSDHSGNWPSWNDIRDGFKRVVNWVDNNIIKPVTSFVNDIVEDVKNFDINNQSEKKALESNYISSYKGVPVIRTEGDRSGSFGAIFLTRETNYRLNPEDVVRHEYGHTQQLAQLGVVKYALCIGLPSWQQWGTGDYYSKPFEITADLYGGVQSRNHTQNNIDRGFAYLERSKEIGPFVWLFIE